MSTDVRGRSPQQFLANIMEKQVVRLPINHVKTKTGFIQTESRSLLPKPSLCSFRKGCVLLSWCGGAKAQPRPRWGQPLLRCKRLQKRDKADRRSSHLSINDEKTTM